MQPKRKSAKSNDTLDTRGRKRTRDASVDIKTEDKQNEPAFRLAMPKTLKGLLIDDWESINKAHQVVKLPSTMTVTDILNRYLKNRKSHDEMVEQTIQGLKLYFNHSLNTMLLYRSERKQYDNIHGSYPDKELTDIYGLEHFLRLFGKVRWLMSRAQPLFFF
ncbi:MRG-domain-containing protein [Hesseltinella vesiculosa]|uniref:MRG-domain-containing protein n=1 Tax=Hesseltinella vesiculosa TaxID=101127 RepID=A0A1X2G6N6_9FUNG|nr:MRG-domain-containing protein [Hesseltinella vesiculosa]